MSLLQYIYTATVPRSYSEKFPHSIEYWSTLRVRVVDILVVFRSKARVKYGLVIALIILPIPTSSHYHWRSYSMSLSPSGDSHVSKVIDDDRASTIRQPSLDFSDHEVTDNDHDDLEHPGDYSTRMEELFEDGENESSHGEDEDSDDEENFLYTGADALDMPAGYRDQLRDVLGPELTDDDEIEAHEVERSLVIEESDGILHGLDDEPLVSFAINGNTRYASQG